MKKKKDYGKELYKMLLFQYKPLEAKLEKIVPADDWKKYKRLSYSKKIHILDGMAQKMGM